MTVVVQNGSDIVVTLEIGQGPAGPSTVAAQAAQALAELARDAAAMSASQAAASEANVNAQEMFAQEWASKLVEPVEGTEYSAKENAIGEAVPTGSAKRWASGIGVIAAGLFSAKTYAENALGSQNLVQTLFNTFVQDLEPNIPAWIFTNYTDARNAYVDQTKPIQIGDVVLILRDERFGGGRTYSRADAVDPSLLLDFNNNIFSTSDPLGFISYAGLSVIDVPATSTSFGYLGAFAISSTHLFVATGNNTWKRIALESF